MTADRDLDRKLRSWFAERATPKPPDGLLERSVARVRDTRQRPGWLVRDRGRARPAPWRSPRSNMLARVAATALVAVLAVAGMLYLAQPGGPAVGVPGVSTGPSQLAPTPSATPAATSTPTPTDRPHPNGPMGVGRQIHTATGLADGRVLVVGGYDYYNGALASAALYDPGTDRFSPTGSLATGRGLHTATLLADGRVLIAGGGPLAEIVAGPFLASAELYDPTTGTFSATGSMTVSRAEHTATLLADGRVLIAGGDDEAGHALASAELYDPKAGTFSATGSMMTARAFQTATLLSDGRVLIAGGSPAGWSCDTGCLASAEIYDPKTGTFSPTGPMTSARLYHTATLLADGRVLATGGNDNSGNLLSSAELYDPKTGRFSPTGSMADGRMYHTATLLADGRVLVVGGGGDYTTYRFLASAELYDPITGTFSATGPMAEARTYLRATPLVDGRVLVTGGYGAQAPLGSAEIFHPMSGTFTPAGSGR